MRSRLLPLSVSLLALLICAPASGYEIMKANSTGKELRWTSLPMKFNIENGSLKGLNASQCQAAIRAAYKAWSSVSCSVFSTSDKGVVSVSSNNNKDHVNTHAFPSVWAGSYPQNALAFTRTSYDPSSGKILDADVLYNPKHTWSDSGAFSAYDLQSVATHEIGHEMGFDHSQYSTATMYYATPNGATHQRSLHSDDIAAACHSYGNGTTLPPECTTNSHCATGEVCTAGKCVVGVVTKKAYGASCTYSSDCTSNLCIQSGGKGSCSQSCTSAACPNGDSCANLSGGGKACLPGSAATAKGLGEQCQGSTDCKSKLCVTWNGKGICTHKCDVTAQNCADGFKCTATSLGGLCVAGAKPTTDPPKDPPKDPPTPATKKLGDKCGAGSECKSGLCGKTSAGQVCILHCDLGKPSTCPTGFKCDKMANNVKGACVKGSSNPGGNNNPPNQPTKGALGATCKNHDTCQSGICATDSNTGRSFCTKMCQPSVGCGQSFSCVSVGGGKHACSPATGNPANPGDPNGYDEAGGCSVAPGQGALPLVWGVFLLLLPGLRPRRQS